MAWMLQSFGIYGIYSSKALISCVGLLLTGKYSTAHPKGTQTVLCIANVTFACVVAYNVIMLLTAMFPI